MTKNLNATLQKLSQDGENSTPAAKGFMGKGDVTSYPSDGRTPTIISTLKEAIEFIGYAFGKSGQAPQSPTTGTPTRPTNDGR